MNVIRSSSTCRYSHTIPTNPSYLLRKRFSQLFACISYATLNIWYIFKRLFNFVSFLQLFHGSKSTRARAFVTFHFQHFKKLSSETKAHSNNTIEIGNCCEQVGRVGTNDVTDRQYRN